MNVRLATPASDDMPRKSVRVKTLAERWECDVRHIFKLIESGELEAHRLGARAVRVYLDSATAYQNNRGIAAKDKKNPGKPPRPAAPNAAHRAAVARLRKAGLC